MIIILYDNLDIFAYINSKSTYRNIAHTIILGHHGTKIYSRETDSFTYIIIFQYRFRWMAFCIKETPEHKSMSLHKIKFGKLNIINNYIINNSLTHVNASSNVFLIPKSKILIKEDIFSDYNELVSIISLMALCSA